MLSDQVIIRDEIIPYLAPGLQELLLEAGTSNLVKLEEIRLRVGQPLILRLGDEDYTIDQHKKLTRFLAPGYRPSREDLYRSIASISDNSLYALAEELKRGFITLPGGHRVGLAGQVVIAGNDIASMKDFSGICFRIARQVKGCALPLLPNIINNSKPVNTLILSSPRCGKTTMLRDLARIISEGGEEVEAQNVVIVDERSELAGCFQGISQLDVGPRTDVLDSCPKAMGMIMAIRSLSPQVIVADEIGRREDAEALQECINAGVTVITSVHAGGVEELHRRPWLKQLLDSGVFKVGVVLGRRSHPGYINDIYRWD